MAADQAVIGAGAPVLAFDVGGTDIKAALFDADGRACGLRRTPAPVAGEDSPHRLIARLRELGEEIRAENPWISPQAVGLIVPGIVDEAEGIGEFSSNLGWRNAPIRRYAEEAFGLPLGFGHDVRTAAWAEYSLGAAREFDDCVVLVIGTGIAGTIFLGGSLIAGGGYAGEVGHSPVAAQPRCACGAWGCLEAIASAGAIARRYREQSGADIAGAKEVLALAAAGDGLATRVWDDALDALAVSMTQLTAILAPQSIVIGGGLSRAGDALFSELRARVSARMSFHRMPMIIPATLQGNAGIIGAAMRARDIT